MNKPKTPTPPQQSNQSSTPKKTSQSTAASIWALSLGIASLLVAANAFISAPVAAAAIIIGSIGLMKRRPGKGKYLTGVITGGVALLVLVPALMFTGQALNNTSSDISNNTTATPPPSGTSATTKQVSSDCYTYAIPKGYVYEEASRDCHTAVNYPNGDDLTRIQVKGTTGTVGTLDEVVSLYNNTLKQADPSSKGVVDQEQFTSNGKTVYYISYVDNLRLLTGVFIVKDPESTQLLGGEPIVAYSVLGYTYNSTFKSIVRGIVDSLETK